ncbi:MULTISPECIES: STAS domain-containing protein [Streptomyces]|uniref:STAS domain-containing protein n=1 Tax=Streptomyces TaxID=1883 RepID=UPI00068C6ACE|nr:MULTISPECIES: STAS domain-containing protein [Streptomyces]MCH0558281.1 STAS domain-containing protein [Streptomyces sp. MUM 16J]
MEHGRPAAVTAHRPSGATTVLPLRGEIDLLTAPTLAERIDALTAHPHPDLVLDLRPVDFIDCAGLRLLCRARNRALAKRGRLRLVTDSAGFLRMLRAAGLWGVFEVHARLPSQPTGTNGSC